jgi:hypothetical protein
MSVHFCWTPGAGSLSGYLKGDRRSNNRVRLSGKLKSIEDWASGNPERERLLIILICVVLVILVILAIGITALVMSPSARPS